ncbi:hypothetical protein FLONG3_6465 [Fusarium longipes]|uniref:Uncharacterized protein n=1 Tax=Fusarium longipes TaxID=694270 RepID=A0A395SM24_9HYPO|nr:hypothetical protein FLONG3_6465 [Fusarium longipes]
MRRFKLGLVAFGAFGASVSSATPRYIDALSNNAKELFTESMAWMDEYYDTKAGYLYDFSAAAALRHETRSSAWYGTYQMSPEEPLVGSPSYPAAIYNTWDPNWRGFIGTTFIMALEEFPKLISKPTQRLMLESLHNATKGDEYRFGNLDPKKDNLYPSYSNPAIMRAFMSGWTGRRLRESNMTRSGERYAKDIIDLFDRANTLSEFNSGTYTGVSLYGLTLWSKYLPEDSIMAKYGPKMVKHTWEAVGDLWHPGMKNMAGPWDRSYGYDMNRYLSLMALWFWAFIGKENSSLIQKPQVMSHMADYAWAPLFAVLARSHEKLIPKQVLKGLTVFKGEHSFQASTFYPPFDTVPRNISTWVSRDLTIGAQSFRQISLGGPAQNQEAYNPAVVQWNTGKEISFISLYPSETALDVKVDPGTFIDKPTIEKWEDVPNLRVNISGNINPEYQLSFGGAFGGSSQTLRDFELWNFTYTMPKEFEGTPALTLDLETLV